MSNFAIRLAQPSDLEEIVRIVEAAYHPWIAVIGRKPAPMLADYPTLIGRGSVWVGEQNGSLIAVLVVWAHDDALYIDNIAVQPEFQRRGIAERLLEFAEAQARENQLPALRLMTNAKMLSNQAYYRKHDFMEIRRQTTDDGRHIVWMEKPLALTQGVLMSYHILVPDNVHPSAVTVLKDAQDANPGVFTYAANGQITREALLEAMPQVDALVIRSAHKIDADVLAKADKLKIIARAGVGVDNVDIPEATRRGIVVVNTPDGNTVSTAEYAFGLMLALARHIPEGYQSMREGKWDRKSYMGVELRGKTLGIVGFGRIGRAIAKRAHVFEMTVIAFDPYVSAEAAEASGVELVSLEAMYPRADFITLHALLNDETREMINAETLAKMKRGVRLINAARGALVDEAALAEAVKSGQVAGAALDVFTDEPPLAENPLVGLPGVIHTPHLAASTEDAQIVVAVDAAKMVIDALLNGVYNNMLNPEVREK